MANSFIGKAISLISHSDVRYRGILAGIDPVNSTIQLQNVYSMGTENRRPQEEFIPPADSPYQYIIFRASEVKDLALDEIQQPPARFRTIHDDPAVLNASTSPLTPDNYNQSSARPPAYQPDVVAPQPQPIPSNLGSRPAAAANVPSTQSPEKHVGTNGTQAAAAPQGQAPAPQVSRTSSRNRRANGSVSSATASLEKVEKAIGDLRLSTQQSGSANQGRNGGRRNGGRVNNEIKVPAEEFDFATANARFDKVNGVGRKPVADSDERTNPSDDEDASKASKEAEKKSEPAYDPKRSFFDSLSSANTNAPRGGGRGGGGRRGAGKSRREEEREKNVATFGEPGGVGLMGPGAYVGGYGGRRGGGRGRRAPGGTGRRVNVVADQ